MEIDPKMGHDLGLSALPDYREEPSSGLDLSRALALIDPTRLSQHRLFTSPLGLAHRLCLGLGPIDLEVVKYQMIGTL
jgi:hypothetical protein